MKTAEEIKAWVKENYPTFMDSYIAHQGKNQFCEIIRAYASQFFPSISRDAQNIPNNSQIANLCHQYVTRLNQVAVDDAMKLQVLKEFADSILPLLNKEVEIKKTGEPYFKAGCRKCSGCEYEGLIGWERFCPSCGSKIKWVK